jgi:hypothetical protein
MGWCVYCFNHITQMIGLYTNCVPALHPRQTWKSSSKQSQKSQGKAGRTWNLNGMGFTYIYKISRDIKYPNMGCVDKATIKYYLGVSLFKWGVLKKTPSGCLPLVEDTLW